MSTNDTISKLLQVRSEDIFLVLLIVIILLVISTLSLLLYLVTTRKKNIQLQLLFEEKEKQRHILDSLFQTAPVGIVVTDSLGIIASYNEEFIRLFKLDKNKSYEGQLLQTLILDNEFQQYYKVALEKRIEKIKDLFEISVVFPDGSVGYFQYKSKFVETQDSSHTLLINIFVEVTKQKQFELSLKKSEEKYRTFVELSTDAIYCFEAKEPVPIDFPIEEQIVLFFKNGFLSDCNLAFAKFYGFESVEDTKGAPLSKIISPANESKMALLLNFISNNYKVDGFITYLNDNNGNLFYVRNSLFGVIENGTLVRVWGVFQNVTDLVNLQRQYQETATKYENLVENVNSIILHIDLNGNIIYINNFGLKFFGYSKEELIGKNVIGTIVPEIESVTGRNLIEQVKNIIAEPLKYEYNINENIRKDGTRVWISWKNTPIYDSNGNCVEILAVGIDITEQRKKELELQRIWNLIYSMFDALPDAISFKDPEGRWIYANQSMMEIFNLVGKEVIGKTDYELIQYDEFFREALEGCAKSDQMAWEAKVPLRLEEKIKTKDGKERIFDLVKVPTFNEDGTRRGIGVVARDVTFLKEVEKLLIESEQKHKEIVNALPLPSFVVSEGKIIFANNNAKKLFNNLLDNAEVDFSVLENYFKEKDFSKLQKIVQKGKLDYYSLFKIETKDGEKIFSVSVAPVSIGTTISTLFVLNDVTEQVLYSSYLEKVQKELIYQRYELERINKELNEKNKELAELNRTKDKFFSIIAHDLKNPVYGVKNLTEEFLRSFDELKYEEMREFVFAINSSTSKLADLVEDLLVWARAQTRTINYNPVDFNLRYVVENTLSFYTENAKQKNIVILNRIEEDVNVFADVNCVSTILRNLISNAIKFTFEGGVIRIFSQEIEEDGQLFEQISVQDNGMGIPYEVQDKLLQLDFHYTGLGTKNERGTGLGLTISNELVKLNGGRLWFESTPKVGSTFHFTIPKKVGNDEKN